MGDGGSQKDTTQQKRERRRKRQKPEHSELERRETMAIVCDYIFREAVKLQWVRFTPA